MLQEFLGGSDLLQWPIAGLVLFFLTFLAVLAYVIFGVKRRKIDHVSSLPLEDDDPNPARVPAGDPLRPSRARLTGRGR